MKYLKRNGALAENDDPLTNQIIGIAVGVQKELGTGFLESIYHRSLEIALAEAKVSFESEVPLAVMFKGHVVGKFAADLIIEGKVLVELKAVEALSLAAGIQVVNYLKATGLDVGLLLNFGSAPLQIKRKYRNHAPVRSELRLQEV